MAPNKKKKKSVANSARGFATTSIPSKPKVEKLTETVEAKTSSKEIQAPSVPLTQASPKLDTPKPIQKTPEELEAQLERDELQLLVEKCASKTRRESRRQVSRIQADRRVLRPQSQSMYVHEWLSSEILDNIISLAQIESNDSNRRQAQQPLLKVLTEEDAMSKLWTLDLIFRDLGFSHAHVQAVLKWLCANAVNVDATAAIWGFQEGLEWLALNYPKGHSFSYEESKPHRTSADSPSIPRPGTPSSTMGPEEATNGKITMTETSSNGTPNNAIGTLTPTEPSHSESVISDLESDIEPDQLVPTYLKIKGRLFEIDPDAVESKSRKPPTGKKKNSSASSAPKSSPSVKKLLSQLRQLESDALFNRDEAKAQWPMTRNHIAQTLAAERKHGDTQAVPSTSVHDQGDHSVTYVAQDSNSPSEPLLSMFGDEEAGIRDMFSAIPDQENIIDAASGPVSSASVTIRDFGKQSGLTPLRLLEEAVRSRDQGARLVYNIISENVYSCRSSLIIRWTKIPNVVYEEDIPGVVCKFSDMQAVFQASTMATVSVEQSHSYIATAALFSLFAASAREEKTYLRLPSNWRDLYREFLDHQKDAADAADRDAIKNLRSIIQDQLEDEESGGMVLTNQFKRRSQASTANPNASNSGRSALFHGLENLQEIWSLKSSTPTFRQMLSIRSNLPVYGFRDSILSTIGQNQVTILCGETGCGKSTQVPSYILEHSLSQGKQCKIFCTEPRRISAISLAQRVSEELGEGPKDLGTPRSLVGYAIRLETKTSAQSRLVYATVGVVLRMLESSKNLDEVTHLIIDEVHERNIDTDFLLIVLRSLMILRPDLKVVLMSATVDAQRFSKYLNDAPILTVPGRTFPVQTKFLEDAIEYTHYNVAAGDNMNDSDTSGNEEETESKGKSGIPSKLSGYSNATRNVLASYDEYCIDYDLIVRLIESVAFDPHLTHYSNAFLVFLPGIAEIRQLHDMFLSHPSFDKNWLIYPLHSTISSDEQQAAFVVPSPGARKIVLATNIAETGITIPDITCVIDTGKHKEMRFDERRQLSRLTQSFISRANAKQRRGRAGRVQEGLCFHLFTKYRHDNMMTDQQTPEMLRLSLQDLVMRTKICKLGDIEKTLSEALDPPSSRNIRRAIDALVEVNALTASEELTSLGRQLAKLPLDAHLGKLVLLSSIFGCVDVAITIAAILSSKSPFLTPFGAKQRADATRMAFKKGDSDLLTAFNAYKSWKAICTTPGRSEVQFCQKNFLSAQNLSNIEDLKAQLLSSLVDAGFIQLTVEELRALSRYRSTARHRSFVSVPAQHNIHSDNDILVNSVIATAFYPKILIRDGKGWRNISNNQNVSLAPTSVNKATPINPSTAKFLSYYHIMQSTNKFYNAHSTSIVHPLPMVLMVGADMDFKLHAGVISFQGNVLRFSAKDWTVAVALKVLRRSVKEILAMTLKNPCRTLSSREREWFGLFFRIFAEKQEKEDKIRERAGGKGK